MESSQPLIDELKKQMLAEPDKLKKAALRNRINLLLNDHIEKPREIKRLCAWCDADKSQTKKLRAQGYAVSHGICEKHKKQIMEELK